MIALTRSWKGKMRIDNIKEISREELNALPYSTSEIVGKKFRNIIIIPTDEIHDSGFRCMKYILLNFAEYGGYEVVGVVGGYSDVLHLWKGRASIDCLPCGYLRVMLEGTSTVPYFIGSDFFVERGEEENGKVN